jgi:hypothetical protein
LHIFDSSGSTDFEGNEIETGEHDPVEDVRFLYTELDMWLYGILKRNWDRISRRISLEKRDPIAFITEQLAGLGFEEWQIKESLKAVNKDFSSFNDEDIRKFATELRKRRLKMVIAANKADKAPGELIEKLLNSDEITIPTSASIELTLRTASQNKFIKYLPGDKDFEITKDLNEKQTKALEIIRDYLKKFQGTGVQKAINSVVFDLLDYIVVYPVEDENKYTDTKGNVLPDAFLVKRGTNARELAYQIHTDIGKNFIFAVDAKKKMRISENQELKDKDVIKIASGAK